MIDWRSERVMIRAKLQGWAPPNSQQQCQHVSTGTLQSRTDSVICMYSYSRPSVMIFAFYGHCTSSRKFVDSSTGHRPLEQIGSEDLSGEETSSSEQSSAAAATSHQQTRALRNCLSKTFESCLESFPGAFSILKHHINL